MGHINKDERNEIQILLEKKYSLRAIAKVLGRSASSISREIKNNSVKGEYVSGKAHQKAQNRWRGRKHQLKKIRENDELEKYVRGKLEELWSPEIIAGTWNKEHTSGEQISHVTIYKYIYSRFGKGLGFYLYTERHRPKKRKGKRGKKELIPNRTFIDLRPSSINLLESFGHRECDLIVGPQGTKPVMLTLVEKVSRLKIAYRLPGKSPQYVLEKLLEIIPIYRMKTITFDNGVEFMYHDQLGIDTYFCHPYHSREKGQIERANRDYRVYVPKGTDISTITQEYLDDVTQKLNNRPMKCLGFYTPQEIYNRYTLSIIPSVAFDPLM